MYRYESWTIKKAACQSIKKTARQKADAFELCWRRLLRVSWTARRSDKWILKGISPELIQPVTSAERTNDYLTHSESESHSVVSSPLPPMDCNPPGSSVHGILQARILDWVAISFSRGPSPARDQTCISCTAGKPFPIWASREEGTWYVRADLLEKALILGKIEGKRRRGGGGWDG